MAKAKKHDQTELQKLGSNIRKHRQSKDYTQEDLAYDAGVSNRTIQRLENGHNDPKFTTLTKLAKILKVKTTELIDF